MSFTQLLELKSNRARHCERSEAISALPVFDEIASSSAADSSQ